GTGGTDHAVHLEWPSIRRVEGFRRLRKRSGCVAGVGADPLGYRLRVLEIVVNAIGAGRQLPRGGRPGDLQGARRSNRGPFALGHDTEEVPFLHDSNDARNTCDRSLVDRDWPRVDDRWP